MSKLAFQLFDTSVLIPYFRGWAYAALIERSILDNRLWLSSVVLQELYAGTRSDLDKKDLDRIDRGLHAVERVVTPRHEDWVAAGVAISRYARLYGEIRPRDHINDLLILIGAARVDADLVTENAVDMNRWARILRKGGWEVRVKAVTRG